MDPFEATLLASGYPDWLPWVLWLQWIVLLAPGPGMIAWTLLFEKSEVRGTRIMQIGSWWLFLGVLLGLVSFPFGGPSFLFTALLSWL